MTNKRIEPITEAIEKAKKQIETESIELEIKSQEIKKYYDTFDSNDITNPLIFDIKLIYDLHRKFDGYLWDTMNIESFKNCFRVVSKKLIIKKGVTLSMICYFFGLIEPKQTGVKSFPDWITTYHVNGNFGKLKKTLTETADNASSMRKHFSLTIPQEKAIENKQKIDTLFNRIAAN